MTKFEQMLRASNKEIKETRSKMLAEEVMDSKEEMLREFRAEKRQLTKKLSSLTDLHRDSELSLKVTKDNFDAKSWLNEVHGLKMEIYNVDVKILVAEEIEKEFFAEASEVA